MAFVNIAYEDPVYLTVDVTPIKTLDVVISYRSVYDLSSSALPFSRYLQVISGFSIPRATIRRHNTEARGSFKEFSMLGINAQGERKQGGVGHST